MRKKKTDPYNIFSHQIDLEELLLDLGIDIPKLDKTQAPTQQKLESRSITRLKSYQPAADQYVLIPRITRFIHQGTIYPCTDIHRPLRRHPKNLCGIRPIHFLIVKFRIRLEHRPSRSPAGNTQQKLFTSSTVFAHPVHSHTSSLPLGEKTHFSCMRFAILSQAACNLNRRCKKQHWIGPHLV